MAKINFFPRKDIDIKICDYRHGKRFAVQQNTDAAFNQYTEFQLFQAFKYNFKATIFASKYNYAGSNGLSQDSFKELAGLGVFELQQYFPTDKWINPTTGIEETIPDYYATVWTSAGATAFENAVAGQPKPDTVSSDGTPIVNRLFPNHGQELYDVTNGRLGYDVTTAQKGTNNLDELTLLIDKNQDWHKEIQGKKASVFSYRNGRNYQPILFQKHYLAARNSNRLNRYYYGISKVDSVTLGTTETRNREDLVNQVIKSRWVDSYISTTSGAATNANNLIKNSIDAADTNRGAYVDFSHWHNVAASGNLQSLEDLFKTYGEHLDTNNLRDDVWIAGYGELWEYFWFRELVDRVVGTQIDNDVFITLQWSDLTTVNNGFTDSIPLELIDTPLSVEIDLTGTYLANKQVVSSYGKLISLGSNKYIVEIPFTQSLQDFHGVKLSEGSSGLYDTSIPIATTSLSGNTLSVTTNQDTKTVLFSHLDTEDIYNLQVDDVDVNYTSSKTYTIEIGRTYYLGCINSFGLKKLILV